MCVSDFIRRCFLNEIEHPLSARALVTHTGVPRGPAFSAKENRIVYVGRVVPEKGVLELVQALARVLPQYPEWSGEVIGARWFGSGGKATAYENAVARAASSCDRIALSGFKPHEDVLVSLGRAAIAAVPSLWDDPFPRTALEALAQGCALICSTRGGLPELGPERAQYLGFISVDSLRGALGEMIANRERREALQRRAREDFPFDILRTTSALDDLRERLMSPP